MIDILSTWSKGRKNNTPKGNCICLLWALEMLNYKPRWNTGSKTAAAKNTQFIRWFSYCTVPVTVKSNSAGFTEVRGGELWRQAEHIRDRMTGHSKRSESTSSEWAWHHWRFYCCDALRSHHAAAESAVCAERLCLRWPSTKVHTVGIQGEGREGDGTWMEEIKQSTVMFSL